jgi:glutaredoxin 3
MARVEIYTTASCGFCFAAKALFDSKKIPFEETGVSDPEKRAAMTQRAKGARTVPQIFINGVHIGGYDDLSALERSGKLDPMLGDSV